MTELLQAPTGGSSALGAGFNLVNTIIGSGILALPYALREAGFYFGAFSLVLVAVLVYFSLLALIHGGRASALYKYEQVARAALGPLGHRASAFALTVNSLGSCTSYLIIIGDTLSAFAPWPKQTVIVATAVVCTLPLLFFRTLEPLVRASVVSTLCLPVIVGIVAVRGPSYTRAPAPTPVFGPSVLPAFGVIAFAFACTQTCFQSYLIMRNKAEWSRAAGFATALALAIYLLFSISSYMAFGLQTEPNLLNNFDNDDVLANIARALLAFSLLLTYPMQFYPVRDLLNDALGLHHGAGFNLVAVGLFALTLATALVVDDLGVVFKLVGTAASSLIVFVLPGAIYLKLVSLRKHEAAPLLLTASSNAKEPLMFSVSVLLLVLGAFVFVIGTWGSIADMFSR
ncbi:hypothetical protein GGI25_004774 [Coemansia spiralis]|uniref:Amino acid transporter transmembrane domain-containing protein n=2 Tax=Coemansia TaxID=4863 RepID=A0A9W8G5W7_9FUNG|nr:transmembrane amino acid transporter protein-domain-containing protein [Coemansia spiralis]KAJ1988709.1 hypothetical protein EDC05_005115 [Coemansia umbellata]KAJ2620076.1 hypothetical protein GGI26_005308 [Coemansia sp. RSA 1358]KAJ2673255.1 hypothetical protein GGI25_004774 [Coemansia spiralis]